MIYGMNNKLKVIFYFQGVALTVLAIVAATIGILLCLRYKRNRGSAFMFFIISMIESIKEDTNLMIGIELETWYNLTNLLGLFRMKQLYIPKHFIFNVPGCNNDYLVRKWYIIHEHDCLLPIMSQFIRRVAYRERERERERKRDRDGERDSVKRFWQ